MKVWEIMVKKCDLIVPLKDLCEFESKESI
jgi:hypothetical protein